MNERNVNWVERAVLKKNMLWNERGVSCCEFWIYEYLCLLHFSLIFKFILIYLLDVLFVLKIEGIFRKENPTQKA